METNLIHTGDAFDVLPDLPDESIHAVVTDPPYGLAFMGRDWDDFKPREYQEWSERWARECKRVLKPGGHLLAFSGNRTHHRLFTGVEDAGFEIRDTLTWHYGCLSEDTEVLTPDGWRTHDEITDGDDVVAFDPGEETFNVEATNRVFRYDHDGEMVRFTSPHTDQLLTPNHRVLHRKGGGWKTSYAGGFYGYTELPVIHGAKENTSRGTGRNAGSNVCELREHVSQAAGPGGREQLLRSKLLRRVGINGRGDSRTPTEHSTEGGEVPRGAGTTERGNERREQPGVEGRRYLQASKGELQAGDYGSVPARVRGNGAGERVRAGTPLEGGKGVGAAAHVHGSGTPQGPRQSQQRLREFGAVAQQPATQVSRGEPRGVPVGTTVARTSRVAYSGTVWCVNVPSSYFVARRNGKVFITGNSGFPKASDVSKTIDKRAGAERELGEKYHNPDGTTRDYDNYDDHNDVYQPSDDGNDARRETIPTTDAAKKWDGWKTGLKPATEFVVMARKPYDGATADSVLEHGTGALNIEACRIGTYERTNPGQGTADGVDYGTKVYEGETVEGRYPSNLIFDEVAAGQLDNEVGDTPGAGYEHGGEFDSGEGATYDLNDQKSDGYVDQGGPSRYFYTSKATKSERTLDGKIDNAHPTVKPTDLMEWLVKLVTAENQIVLDPFCGSGTTCMAAKNLNRQFIGIERQDKWADVARVRVGLTPNDPSVVRGDTNQNGLESYL